MTQRFYTNTSPTATLNASVGTGNTTFNLSGSGLTPAPAFPYFIIVDRDQVNEEACIVTGGAPTALTVTRAADGTTAASHSAGATVEHGVLAEFYNKADAHVEASTNVHGLTGGSAVAGTTQAQTLTNKTITTSTASIASSTVTGDIVKVTLDDTSADNAFVVDRTNGSATGKAVDVRVNGASVTSINHAGAVVAGSAVDVSGGLTTQRADASAALTVQGTGPTTRVTVNGGGDITQAAPPAASTATRITTNTIAGTKAWDVKDSTAATVLQVDGVGNLSLPAQASASGNRLVVNEKASQIGLQVAGPTLDNLVVGDSGGFTNNGYVQLPLQTASATADRLRIDAQTSQNALHIRNSAAASRIKAKSDGILSVHDGASPVVATVLGDPATIVSAPATYMAVFRNDGNWYVYNGTAWAVMAYMYSTAGGHARYRQVTTAAQSIANNTVTACTFDTAITTTPDVTASGTNNTTFTVNRSGLWQVDCTIQYNTTGAGGGGIIGGWIIHSGSAARIGKELQQFQNNNFNGFTAGRVVYANSGDTFKVELYQTSGANQPLGGTNPAGVDNPEISLTWLRY